MENKKNVSWQKRNIKDCWNNCITETCVTFNEECSGEFISENFQDVHPLKWNIRINPENGNIKIIIKEDSIDKNISLGLSKNNPPFTIRIENKDSKEIKEDVSATLTRSETYKKNNICSFFDWRRFFHESESDILAISIKCDNGDYNLGEVSFDNFREFFPKYIGDRGPGLGTIFYDKGDDNDGWRYLEVGQAVGLMRFIPKNNEDFMDEAKNVAEIDRVLTGTAVGLGRENTKKIVAAFEDKIYEDKEYAAKECQRERNKKKDWFLPSKDELRLIYDNLINNPDIMRDAEKSEKEADSEWGGFGEMFPEAEDVVETSENEIMVDTNKNDTSNDWKTVYFYLFEIGKESDSKPIFWSSSKYVTSPLSSVYAYVSNGCAPQTEEHYVIPVRAFKL